MLSDEDRRVASVYRERLRTYGPGPAALHWRSRESQERRFTGLAAIGIRDGDSVLDVGCGLADFYGWLKDRGVLVSYIGMDFTAEMVALSRETYPEARFMLSNLVEGDHGLPPRGIDWVVASGIFSMHKVEPEQNLQRVVGAMAALARRGVAFNTLSARAPHRDRWRLWHADPDRILVFCRALGFRCRISHDAAQEDFTIHMLCPSPAPSSSLSDGEGAAR